MSRSHLLSFAVLFGLTGCGTLDATGDARELGDVGDLAWEYSEDACPEPEDVTDTPQDGQVLVEGVNQVFILNHVDDVDYYVFEIPPHRRAFLETGTDGMEFAFFNGIDLDGDALPEHGITNGSDEPMAVLVRVTGDEDCVGYYLHLHFLECRSEDVLEPNDTPEQATPLARGTEISSILTGDNPVDMFALDPVMPGDEMFAYLAFDSDYVDIDLRVTTADGGFIGLSNGSEPVESVRWTNEGPETVTPIVEVYMFDFFGPDQCVQAEYMLLDL